MPELTVSMPAYNSGKFIKEAIESVLKQEGIDFELIVVDDGSDDNTSQVVSSFCDKRIKLIKNTNNMGIAYCHNLVIESSSSPFIAHVDSDDMILPGALKKMVEKIKSSPNIGQVHCLYMKIDDNGKITREYFRQQRQIILNRVNINTDYKKQLLSGGMVANHLRTYRREVFDNIGRFNEKLKYGADDYEMAIRVADKYEIRLVPEFLYCYRIHEGSSVEKLSFSGLRFWIQRIFMYRRLLNSGTVSFLNKKEYDPYKYLFFRLAHVLKLYKISALLINIIRPLYSSAVFFTIRTINPACKNFYYYLVNNFSSWPISFFKQSNEQEDCKEKHIAYYLWQFPVLSETFIRRELIALIKSGLSVNVIADEPGDMELDDYESSTIKKVDFLEPLDNDRLEDYKKYFFRKKPLNYINLYLYVLFHKYSSNKSYKKDKSVFSKAVYLAGILRDGNISHIHSPWANRCAFTALIASRLLGVPYTVQARAYDIHRETFKYALKEKFENARFVITNTNYNEQYIRSILGINNGINLHRIYNGIDLNKFIPSDKNKNLTSRIRLLSIARLIEQKGLVYLLKACRILKDKGYSFRCDIVGGTEEPLYTAYYINLKILHRQLELDDCVFFRGSEPFGKVMDRYQQADIFVLPCVVADDGSRDIIPNAVIEAMAMGLAVVSTDVSGVPEIIEDGVSGIIVPPKNEHVLSEAIMNLMEDDGLRKEFGNNARIRVRERFDINKNILKYIDLFKS